MARCPCISLKTGAAMLTVAAAMIAQSRAIFGGSFGSVLATVLHGTASSAVLLPVIGCAGMATAGFFAVLEGWRATQTHYDPFDGMALARAVGGSLLFLYGIDAGWGLDPYAWGPGLAAFGRALLLAGLAYNVAGLWLQLRRPLAQLAANLRAPHWQGHDGAAWQAVAERDHMIAALTHERDRLADDLAQMEANAFGVPVCDPAHVAMLTQENEQLRQTVAAWQQGVADRDHVIDDQQRIIDRQADDLAGKAASCEKFRANGLRYKDRAAQMESFFSAPGVKKRLMMAVHSDHNRRADETQQRALDGAFATLRAIYQHIEAER